MEKKFSMKWNMEWKIFSMEWIWCNDLSKRQSQLPLETLDRHRTRE